jgi:hypothetical protein
VRVGVAWDRVSIGVMESRVVGLEVWVYQESVRRMSFVLVHSL